MEQAEWECWESNCGDYLDTSYSAVMRVTSETNNG